MAIEFVAGESFSTYLTYLYPDNTPITGATFTVVEALKSDGTSFDVSIVENSPGSYHITGTSSPDDPAGEWRLLLQGSADGSYFEEVFDVLARPRPVQHVVEHPQFGQSRAELRRAVAGMLGDLTMVTATAEGTTSSIVDEVNLARELNAFNGMQMFVTAGPEGNVGHVATVASNDPSARTINFHPPLPYKTRAGDTFELYNYRGIGWTIDQYNRAINDALQRAGEEHATLPYSLDVEGSFNRRNPYVTVPQDFAYFFGLETVERDGTRKKVPYRYYSIDPTMREVHVKDGARAHGKTVRILGARFPAPLLSDDARTHINAEWVVHEVMAILLQNDASMGTTQGSRDRLLMLERQQADGRRPSIVTTYPPNSVRLV